MLVGRESELKVLHQAVAGARLAQGGALVVAGEPGIGKTTLLDEVARTVEHVRVLRARGSESERDLAFAGLQQLLRPALDLLDTIPGPQAVALGVALALREGPVDGPVEGTAADRFAVGAATLSLLSRLADDRPLLVVVDDAQWLDRPSAEAIAFVCRRIVADPIAVLVGTRPTDGTSLLDAAVPRLDLDGLSVEAVEHLLRVHAGDVVTPETAQQVHRLTLGNPLAVTEVAGRVDQLDRLPPPTPITVPERLLRGYDQWLQSLPADTRRALLVAAVAEGDALVTEQALPTMGTTLAALGAAEDAGLVSLAPGRVEFRHPLVRASAYATASASQRRAAHRAVAAVQPPEAWERRAWHLAEAAVGTDPEVSGLLTEVGRSAAARGAYAVAATAYERAATLTVPAEERARHLLAAGEAAWLAGQLDRATDLLDRARGSTTDRTLRARIAAVRGNLEMRMGSLRRARALLREAVDDLEATDPDAAAAFGADLVTACLWLGDTRTGLETADRLERLALEATDLVRVRATMTVGMARVLAGRPGIELVRAAVTELEADPARTYDQRRPGWMVLGPLFLRESTAGRELAESVIHDLRRRCALGTLPHLLFHVGRDEATTHRWAAAAATYGEAVDLARETGQTTDLAMCLAGRAWLLARTGQEESCRADAEEAAVLASRYDIHLAGSWAHFALGDLELGAGRPEAALGHYTDLEALLHEVGLADVDLSPGPEMAEALVRLGRPAEATEVASRYRERAHAKGQPWSIARAERAMAFVSDDDRALTHLERAIDLHRGSPDVFEEARTQLVQGEWLRRARRRADARPVLRRALSTFERVGARPWAERAATELSATGEKPYRRGDRSTDRLTPQELRIAGLLATGSTTREAAAALFLSPKTVEYHLRHVYTKLGVRSRAELSRVVAEDDEHAAMSDSR